MPCQDMHTSAFVQEITKVGDELGIVPIIIRGEELNQRGFGGKFVVRKSGSLNELNTKLELSIKLPHYNNIAFFTHCILISAL